MKKSTSRILRNAGAFVACSIGSGFATGQEIIQFFSGQGKNGISGSVLTTLLFSFCGYCMLKHGKKFNLYTPSLTSEFYFGKRLSKCIQLIFQLFLFGVYSIMIAGCGEIGSQSFGFNPMIGRLVLSVFVLITVLGGFEKLVNVISKTGPLIIFVTLIVGSFGFIAGYNNFELIDQTLNVMDLTITKGGWFVSSILYPSFNAVVILFISCSLGAMSETETEAGLSGLLGGFAFGLAVTIMNLGIYLNLSDIGQLAIPTVALSEKLFGHWFAAVYSVIIFLGVYSGTVSVLWSAIRPLAEDKTVKYRILATVFSVAGFGLGMTDFKSLMNIIYPFSGYLGLILIVLFFAKEIAMLRKKDIKAGL